MSSELLFPRSVMLDIHYLWTHFSSLILPLLVILGLHGLAHLRTRRSPPGPSPLPLIGNLLSYRKLRVRPEKTLQAWAHKYGSMTMLWLGHNPMLIINSAKTAKDLLDKRGILYSSRPSQNDFREKMWPRLMNITGGDYFRKVRRLYTEFLSPGQVERFRGYQDLESKKMLCDLLNTPDGFLRHAERYAVSVIFSATYGVRLVDMDHPIIRRFYTLWDEILKWFHPGALPIDYIPALQRLPTFCQPWVGHAKRLRQQENRLHEAFLNTLRSSAGSLAGMPHSFGKMLLECQEEEGIGNEEALDVLAMLIAAGSDTTSSVLGHFFKCVALHPQAMQRAQEELDRVVGRERLPTWDDEKNLPYIRCLIKEVHRWCPIGGFGIPHATTTTDVHDGFLIPKGTIVMPNLASLNRDPTRYDSPDAFKPERFMEDAMLHSSAAATHPDFMKRDHFHYGFGRRLCQGIQVAEASMFIVVSRILWGFEVLEKAGHPLDPNDKIDGLVQKPAPYEVNIHPRGQELARIMQDQLAMTKVEIPNFDDVIPFHDALVKAA